MHLHEKNGGNNRNLDSVLEFREAVQACNLIDIRGTLLHCQIGDIVPISLKRGYIEFFVAKISAVISRI